MKKEILLDGILARNIDIMKINIISSDTSIIIINNSYILGVFEIPV